MDLASSTWARVAALEAPIALLPLGSVEAHGPHLPLDTDTRMAVGLAARCAATLEARGEAVLVAPPVTSTACSYAVDFPGTVDVDPVAEEQVLRDTVRSLLAAGAARVVLVNLHFDPAHMRAVKAAVGGRGARDAEAAGRVLFPDFTRRAHAQRIGGEFATGASHGGAFETSLMLAVAPDAVDPIHRTLPPREVDLARAIREGKRSFRELGLDEAYCGWPARATAEEGERLLGVLAGIVCGVLDAEPPGKAP